MKKFFSTLMMLAMMVAALSFTACGGDDDDDEFGDGSNPSSLVGTWKIVRNNLGLLKDEEDYCHFNQDGTYIFIEDYGNKVETERGSWKLVGNGLVITMPDEDWGEMTVTYTILELKSDSFVLSLAGLTAYYQRVPDDVIKKYLSGDDYNGGEYGNKEYDTTGVFYLEKAGTLSSMLSKSQASELLKLKISGHIDARDFDYIKWDCMKIEEIDLSDVIIDKYTGVEGTEEGNNKTYAANEIPSGAFFYWQDVHKYVYDGMPIDEGMASLKKIILPKGIKAIRRNAFARAYNLKEINIPEGVETIDYVAFAICTSLEEIKLPSSLKTIGKQAFASMDNLKRMYISATTPPSAQSDSFDGKPNTVLYVPKGTETSYKNADGWNSFKSIIGF